jgi:hypothetical protein
MAFVFVSFLLLFLAYLFIGWKDRKNRKAKDFSFTMMAHKGAGQE